MKTKLVLLLTLFVSLAVSLFLAYQNTELRQQSVKTPAAGQPIAQFEPAASGSEAMTTTDTNDKPGVSPAAFGFGMGEGFRLLADWIPGNGPHFDYALCDGFEGPVDIHFEAEQPRVTSYVFTEGEILDHQGFRYRLNEDHDAAIQPRAECLFIHDEKQEEGGGIRMLYQANRGSKLPEREQLKTCAPEILQIIQTDGIVPKESAITECREQNLANGFQQADVISREKETCSHVTLYRVGGTWLKSDVDSRTKMNEPRSDNPCDEAEMDIGWYVHQLRSVIELNSSTFVLAYVYGEHGYYPQLFVVQGKTLKKLKEASRQTIF